MTLQQLHEAIKAGRYQDEQNIWHEAGNYFVTTEVLAPASERVWVDTVVGYKQRHGLLRDEQKTSS